MRDRRSTDLRWLLGVVLIAAGARPAAATIIFPANQVPFTIQAGDGATTIEVCRFQHSTSKKKNDFDVTVNWGDATPTDTFHPGKNGKTKYVARATHAYATCGVYTVTCDVDYKNGLETGSDSNVGTVSGTAPAPAMVVSAVCPASGATGLTASVPSGATSYAWSMLDANGVDLTPQITAGQGTAQITFDAASAGTLMFISLNESAGACPAATATRKVQVDFADVAPTHPQHDAVCTLAANQLTTGCGNGFYCPDSPTTREQIAYLGLAARHWADVPTYDPALGTGVFADVPLASDFLDWIEAAVTTPEGWMAACDATPNFCPSDSVTRAQMTRFLLKSKYGVAFEPPPPAVDPYSDVLSADFAAGFIDQLKTDFALIPEPLGCGVGRFCPSGTATRAHLAHFLVHIFGVPAL